MAKKRPKYPESLAELQLQLKKDGYRDDIYPVQGGCFAGKQLVYYDLETTGLKKPRHITQIGAVADEIGAVFCRYVCPREGVNITAKATRRHKIEKQQGTLVNVDTGEACVPCSPIHNALQKFIKFLTMVKSKNRNKEIILIGHNIASYDNEILGAEAADAGLLAILNQCVHGYIDTKHLFMYEYPDWGQGENEGKGKYKLQTLARQAIHPGYTQAHEAVSDARDLRIVVAANGVGKDVLCRYIREWKEEEDEDEDEDEDEEEDMDEDEDEDEE